MPRPWRRRRSPGFSGARCGCSRSVRCSAVSRSARSVSLGAVLAAEVSGDEAFAGLATAAHHPRHGGLRGAARRLRAPPRTPPVARGRDGGRAGGCAARHPRRRGRLVPAPARRLRSRRCGAGGEPPDAVRRRRPRDRRDARPRPLARRLGDDDRRRARPESDGPGGGRSAQAVGMPPSPGRSSSPSARSCWRSPCTSSGCVRTRCCSPSG